MMSIRKRWVAILLLFLISFALEGCNTLYDSCCFVTRPKAAPVVAIVPPRDSSWTSLPWDVARELEVKVWQTSCGRGRVRLVDPEHVRRVLADVDNIDLHSQDAPFFRRFVGCDYLVLMDLIEHNEVPYRRGEIEPLYIIDSDDAFVLTMKLRLTVYALGQGEARLVLREIVKSNHMVPKALHNVDYFTHCWPRPGYATTPIGVAHERLSRDLVARLEQVALSKVH